VVLEVPEDNIILQLEVAVEPTVAVEEVAVEVVVIRVEATDPAATAEAELGAALITTI
jgi:hypothetical protein